MSSSLIKTSDLVATTASGISLKDTVSTKTNSISLNYDALESSINSSGMTLNTDAAITLSNASGTTNNANTANNKTISANATIINQQYASSSGGRLVKFDYREGYDDSQHRAYFKLTGDTTELKKDIAGDSSMEAILATLESTSGFTSFILTSIAENHQEKQSIMQTINDYFIATFSGHEPQIVTISGILPFDASTTTSSWYLNFVNTYTFLFRASILAKYKLQLKLILPDFSTYICYPTSFTSGLQATQDNIVQFQMVAVVAQEDIQKAKGISVAAQTNKTTAEQVKENNATLKAQQNSTATNSPSAVGQDSNKRNFLETTADFINTAVTGVGTNEIAKGINTVNKVLSSITQVTGAVNSTTGLATGLRKVLKY